MKRWLEAWLAQVTDRALAAAILGDLAEERARRRARSRTVAALWWWMSIVGIFRVAAMQRSRAGLAHWRRAGLGGHAIANEARQTLRAVFQTPLASLIIMLTLALGVGVNTAVFSVVYSVLFHPLPFSSPHRVVVIKGTSGPEPPSMFGTSLEDYRDIVRAQRSFDRLGIAGYWTMNLTDLDTPLRVVGMRVDGGFFATLGTPPLHGRWIDDRDNDPGAPENIVISHGFWQRQFGGRDDVIGAPLHMNGVPGIVVGVMPVRFRFPAAGVEIWAAIRNEMDGTPRHVRFWTVVGRLAGGTTQAQAQSELNGIVARLAADYPTSNRTWRAMVSPALEALTTGISAPFRLLLAAVVVVFVVAGVNVAGLLIARRSSRQKDSDLRRALGATRWRVIRVALLEGMWLAACGAGLGVALAMPAIAILRALAPRSVPRVDEIALQWPALAMAGTVMVLIVAASAWMSEIRLRPRTWPVPGGGRVAGLGRSPVRAGLVVVQIALAFVLLSGAGLLIRSFARVIAVDPGFDPAQVVTLRVFLGPPVYRTLESQRAYADRALEAIRRAGGVDLAGAVSQPPFDTEGSGSTQRFAIEGRPSGTDAFPRLTYRVADPGYFRAMRIPIERGRALGEEDGPTAAPVVVINASMARRYWPGADPIGARIRWVDSPSQPPVTIVGIAGDVATGGLEAFESSAVYAPYAQRTLPFLRWLTFVARTTGDPDAATPGIRAAMQAVDPRQPVFAVRTMESIVESSLAQRRFALVLMAGFAALTLILATLGLYGALAQQVEQRRRELGVRLALGATPAVILRRVIARGFAITAAGVAIGFCVSFLAAGYLATMVFGVSPNDLTTRVGLIAGQLVTSIIACAVPALRASHVDPVTALRAD